MNKLSLENFLNFVKDKENNIENFKTWGLYPNVEGKKAVDFNVNKSSKKSYNNGQYNY